MVTEFQSKLYFAYGSNLALRQMRMEGAGSEPIQDARGTPVNRCPDSQPVAPFELKGFRLAFVGEGNARWGRGGVATLIPARGCRVPGALYRISQADEARLDAMEGVASGRYYKDQLTIQCQGEAALTYIATAQLGLENKPNRKYLDRILEGYRDWGLPASALGSLECYSAEDVLER